MVSPPQRQREDALMEGLESVTGGGDHFSDALMLSSIAALGISLPDVAYNPKGVRFLWKHWTASS